MTIRPGPTTEQSSLEQCVDEVSWWFLRDGLLFNPAKTEAVVFGTRQRLVRSRDRSRPVNLSGVQVTKSDSVKLFGVTLDSALTLDKHVTEVVRAGNYHMRALRHIRPLLSLDSAKSIAASIVGSRLDYCNSVLLGTSERNFNRLQRVQNSLARCVLMRAGMTVLLLASGGRCTGYQFVNVYITEQR